MAPHQTLSPPTTTANSVSLTSSPPQSQSQSQSYSQLHRLLPLADFLRQLVIIWSLSISTPIPATIIRIICVILTAAEFAQVLPALKLKAGGQFLGLGPDRLKWLSRWARGFTYGLLVSWSPVTKPAVNWLCMTSRDVSVSLAGILLRAVLVVVGMAVTVVLFPGSGSISTSAEEEASDVDVDLSLGAVVAKMVAQVFFESLVARIIWEARDGLAPGAWVWLMVLGFASLTAHLLMVATQRPGMLGLGVGLLGE